jgi:hypothetical protein
MKDINKNLLDNLFLNKKYFDTFFDSKFREKRIKDISILSEFYKKHNLFSVNNDYSINKKLLEKWVLSHESSESQLLAINLIRPVIHVSFKDFYENLLISTEKFNKFIIKNNIKKYYIIIGANNAVGTSEDNYLNIGKSNFWTLLIIYQYLKIKPYDILLNLNQAIEFSIFEKLSGNNIITDFVFIDDASYSGNQLFMQTIGTQLLQKKYLNKLLNMKPNKINKITQNDISNYDNTLIKSTNNKENVRIHIIIPYISITAEKRSMEIRIKNNIEIYLYNNYYIKNYEEYYINNEIVIDQLAKKYEYFNFDKNLIPLYFDHKMPDSVSTIDYLLLSGIVVNNYKKNNRFDPKNFKYVQFINNCIYPQNNDMDPLKLKKWSCNKLCPITPSIIAKKYVENYLKKITNYK